MEMQSPVLANFERALCQIIKQCEREVNDQYFGKGNQPSKAWCQAPSTAPGASPGEKQSQELGKAKDACAEKKVNQRKAASQTPFSKTVQTQPWVPVQGGGGMCHPDVIVGTPPNCDAVYDFKTSCPPSPDKKGSWGTYKSKSGATSYEGASQYDVYKDSCGDDPTIIHPNADICNS